jgi:hypothetical protein
VGVGVGVAVAVGVAVTVWVNVAVSVAVAENGGDRSEGALQANTTAINAAIIQRANFRRCIDGIIAGRGNLSTGQIIYPAQISQIT